jgi:hypothetical protein
MKHQMPSIKSQINPDQEIRNIKQKSLGSFGIGIWNLFGIWDLEIGI